MAPEQKEHRTTDHRADIYSLGVVLYEMLIGELPADKLQPPSKRVPVDVRINEVVLRALARKHLALRMYRVQSSPALLVGLFVAVLAGRLPIKALLDLTNIGTLFAFVIVCAAVLIKRKTNPHIPRPFRCPLVPFVPIAGIVTCLLLMFSLPAENWYRLFGWLAIGLCIYFSYGRHHSILGKELRGELARHGASPAGSVKD